MFRELISENSDKMDKKVEKTLDGLSNIKTTSMTSSSWYSPNTTYKIHSVDNGFYSKTPGIYTMVGKEQKFIPLKDIKI